MPVLGEGVSVEQVLMLTPHVSVLDTTSSTVPAPPRNDVWKEQKTGTTPSKEDIQQFIKDVSNAVRMRLIRIAYITNEAVVTTLASNANSIIVVGAAATLVSAVYPAKAGINEQTSYSQELWARYNLELDALQTAMEQALKDQNSSSTGGTSSKIRGTFRDAVITDDLVW